MKILYCCIALNEERTLRRSMESVRGIATDYLVCDTGSTDRTVEIAKEFGTVQQIQFKSYAQAKNDMLDIADSMLQDGDWILLLDADESLESGAEVLQQYAGSHFTCVSGRIVERHQGVAVNTYFRNRMWRARKGWRFQGAEVHEYVSGNGEVVTDGRIVVLHDHSHRTPDETAGLSNRFEHYVEVFSKAIEENPNDARSWFYLARTYKDLNRWWEAIDAYETYLLIQNNLFVDERWQAAYDVAYLWKLQGEYEKAMTSARRAVSIDGRRNESVVLTGWMQYNRKDYRDAAATLEASLSIPYPSHVTLFLDPRMYYEFPADLLCLCYDKLHQHNKAAQLSRSLMRSGVL
jgi:glycosyltransferase involved in cell wall biosynthesis